VGLSKNDGTQQAAGYVSRKESRSYLGTSGYPTTRKLLRLIVLTD
jgi:hypothetical protein